jgi:hypothetical protein
MNKNSNNSDEFLMVGNKGDGNYTVVAVTELGRVGLCDLGDGSLRIHIRVEPSSQVAASKLALFLTDALGWKQPGNRKQQFFSTFAYPVANQRGRQAQMEQALRAVVASAGQFARINDCAPDWALELAFAQLHTSSVPASKIWLSENHEKQAEQGERADLIEELRRLNPARANLASNWSIATLLQKVGYAQRQANELVDRNEHTVSVEGIEGGSVEEILGKMAFTA